MDKKRNVLTIATSKKLYVELAANLARSFYFWNSEEDIDFYIATDLPDAVPDDIENFANILRLQKDELGTGFSAKLHLDKLAPAGQTLFIDSDCLIFGKLSAVFERFKGKPVSVIGGFITDGEWFGDVAAVCKSFKIPHLPKFNGGIYYLENGSIARRVYENARNLESRYDDIGFVRLRNKPNDEVIMALALQLEGLAPVKDDATIMSDPFACPGNYEMDMIRGVTRMTNPPAPSLMHRSWYPFFKVSPLIIHFLGAHTEDYQYKREVKKLVFVLANNYNLWQKLKVLVTIEYAAKLKNRVKSILRPCYRLLFGHRKIKASGRI